MSDKNNQEHSSERFRSIIPSDGKFWMNYVDIKGEETKLLICELDSENGTLPEIVMSPSVERMVSDLGIDPKMIRDEIGRLNAAKVAPEPKEE